MVVELKQVTVDEKEILRNLLEKYSYEFSQWDKRDVNKLGLYGYLYLDNYWTEDKRWAYFILVDGKLAGFAMVNDFPEVNDRDTDFQMAEFSCCTSIGGWVWDARLSLKLWKCTKAGGS